MFAVYVFSGKRLNYPPFFVCFFKSHFSSGLFSQSVTDNLTFKSRFTAVTESHTPDFNPMSVNVGTLSVIPVKVSTCVEPVLGLSVRVGSQLEPPEENNRNRRIL